MPGIFGQWHNNLLELASAAQYNANGHISQEEWLVTNGSAPAWVEMGLVDANSTQFAGPNPQPYNGPAYTQFWAANQGTTFYFHFLYNISPNGVNQSYEIENVGNGSTQYYIFLSGAFEGTATSQTATTGFSQVGIELTQGVGQGVITPGSHADTFTDSMQYAGNGVTYGSPNMAQQPTVDFPCGPNPAGYCFNININPGSVVNVNKP